MRGFAARRGVPGAGRVRRLRNIPRCCRSIPLVAVCRRGITLRHVFRGGCQRSVIDSPACSPCRSGRFKVCRSSGGRDRRLAMVIAGKQLRITGRLGSVLLLSRSRFYMTRVAPLLLLRGRTSLDAALSAVIADPAVVVYDNRLVVDVMNVGDVHVVHGSVVVELPSPPIAAVVSVSGVAEAVIDAAIESDLWAPVAGVPHIGAVIPAPVARGPIKAGLGWHDPGSRNPVVAVIAPRPVTGRPHIPRTRAEGLRINRNWRRSDGDREEYSAERYGGECHQHCDKCERPNEPMDIHDESLPTRSLRSGRSAKST